MIEKIQNYFEKFNNLLIKAIENCKYTPKFIKESNRAAHVVYGFYSGLLTILLTFGIAMGMEVKDYEHGDQFDWYDILATCIGGIFGNIILILIFAL
jgi:hypothetical protein